MFVIFVGVKIMASKFQKRQYIAIAKLFGDCQIDEQTIKSFCEMFAEDNPSFNEKKFRDMIDSFWGIEVFPLL